MRWRGMKSSGQKRARNPGMAFLVVGISLMAVAVSTGQYAFIGVAAAFLVLGVVFMNKSRRVG